jgi:hypothetical protein
MCLPVAPDRGLHSGLNKASDVTVIIVLYRLQAGHERAVQLLHRAQLQSGPQERNSKVL